MRSLDKPYNKQEADYLASQGTNWFPIIVVAVAIILIIGITVLGIVTDSLECGAINLEKLNP